jgi:glycerate kinase
MAKSILVAPDSFKNSLTAKQVASIVAEELESYAPSNNPNWSIEKQPLADGGEGTVEALVTAHDGSYRRSSVKDPLGHTVNARWGMFKSSSSVIEMAEASGFELLDSGELNPLRATTYGTGQLIMEAVQAGAKTIYVGLGGSATVDGGLGMARAIGFRFLDANGDEIRYPERLSSIQNLSDDDVPADLSDVDIVACYDVTNPLLGKEGAATVFGPQKGADEKEVKQLEGGLKHWADTVESHTDRSVRDREGTGAAGGLGFGLAALLGAELRPGATSVMDQTNLNSKLKNVDVLITGEGSMDKQSLRGKTPVAVARRAREYDVRLLLGLAGQFTEQDGGFYPLFDFIASCTKQPLDEEKLLQSAESRLRDGSRDLARLLDLIESSS